MGRDGGCGHIVGRVLHRGKGINLLPQREDNDAARVLSRGPAHAHAALDNPVDLAVSLSGAPLLVVFLHIAVGRLVRKSADGAGPEGLSLAENHLGVVVGLALVLAGEVQVNIWLLVPLKTQECLKGDVKAILLQGRAADRAELIRHIAARHAGEFLYLLGVKVIIAALWTVIVGA